MARRSSGSSKEANTRRCAKLLARGQSISDIARELQAAPEQVERWLQEPEAIEAFKRTMQLLAAERYARTMRLLTEQLDSESATVMQHAAKELLSQCEPLAFADGDGAIKIIMEGTPELGMPERPPDT